MTRAGGAGVTRAATGPGPLTATLFFVIVTIAWTWPLATGLTHDVPWDFGDPLLNAWILAWHFHQAGRLLHGDMAALSDWWHANIFHPSPYAIGQSELLVAQAVQGAPVYALTGNILLTYNLLFLSTFVLSALGAYLLVRSLTRNGRAAIVAGLLYGFALYRVNQGPHLQVLSSQWFPFVLWGLHEWWQQGRWRHAVLAGLALAAQNLSNGYFLVYAALWLPPYVVAQVWLRGRLRDVRAWLGPAIAAAIGVGLTLPFLYPYVQLRRLGQPSRPLAAVVQYSADTYAWLTANDQLRLWGTHLQTMVRPEGDLFPGVVPVLLVAIAVVLAIRDRRVAGAMHASPPRVRRIVAVAAALLASGYLVAIVLALFAGQPRVHAGPITISISDGTRLLVGFALSLGVLLAASPRARAVARDDPQQPLVLLIALAASTVWLSFGPIVHIGGRVARNWPSLYAFVYAFVPGADGLRVPPRIAMVTALALAAIGGLAAHALMRRRHGTIATGVLAVAFMAESWPAPIPINMRIDAAPLQPISAMPPPRPAEHPLARAIAALPADAVLIDLPFGSLPYEVWWQYLSIGHWRARVNGYSGDVPPDFLAFDLRLREFPERLAAGTADETEATAVIDALHARGVTHVVIHADAWPTAAPADALRTWLSAFGATRVVSSAELWEVPVKSRKSKG